MVKTLRILSFGAGMIIGLGFASCCAQNDGVKKDFTTDKRKAMKRPREKHPVDKTADDSRIGSIAHRQNFPSELAFCRNRFALGR